MKTATKKINVFQRFKVWWNVSFCDWPVYRVTYSDGQRTRGLHYLEAKGCRDVFGGKLWIDWGYARKIILQIS